MSLLFFVDYIKEIGCGRTVGEGELRTLEDEDRGNTRKELVGGSIILEDVELAGWLDIVGQETKKVSCLPEVRVHGSFPGLM